MTIHDSTHGQRSRTPRTPYMGLDDSPAGLAAWLLEKYMSWTDCDCDVYGVFQRGQGELLT